MIISKLAMLKMLEMQVVVKFLTILFVVIGGNDEFFGMV